MTHPFHPLLGQTFELLTHRKTWGEDRVFFEEAGRLRAVPAGWTDAVEPPVFVTVAAGRSHFRPDDLLRLVELLDGLTSRRRPSASASPPASSTLPEVSGKLRRECKKKNALQHRQKRRKREQRRR